MNIQCQYRTTADSLARASVIFLETKPLVWFSIYAFNIFAALLILTILAKIFLLKMFGIQDALGFLLCLLWLFVRKPFTNRLLIKRIKAQGLFERLLTIEISKNGIVWHGEAIKQGNLAWKDLKILYRLQNGYIMPCGTSKFLWLPFDGFRTQSEIVRFEKYARELHVKVKMLRRSV